MVGGTTMASTVARGETEEAFKGAMAYNGSVVFGEAMLTMPLRPLPEQCGQLRRLTGWA
jgi:hypothetical protein